MILVSSPLTTTNQQWFGFLERELGYVDAQNVEFQRVHRTEKTKDENPRPILARFLYNLCY